MCVTTFLLRIGTLTAAAAAAGTRWPMPQRADVLDCAAKAAAIVNCFDVQLACSDAIYYQGWVIRVCHTVALLSFCKYAALD